MLSRQISSFQNFLLLPTFLRYLVAYFLKIYHHTKVQKAIMIGASIDPTSKCRTTDMLVLLTAKNSKVGSP
jgi:hypothetical protein